MFQQTTGLFTTEPTKNTEEHPPLWPSLSVAPMTAEAILQQTTGLFTTEPTENTEEHDFFSFVLSVVVILQPMAGVIYQTYRNRKRLFFVSVLSASPVVRTQPPSLPAAFFVS